MKNLGFGLMRLPQTDANDGGSIDIKAVEKMADAFLEKGFTYFDTSYVYHNGKSEIAFREAVAKRYPREAFLIADKMPMFSITESEQLEPIFQEELDRCGVEYFDYMLLHALGKDTFLRSEKIGAFEFLVNKKKDGKIKHIGFSFHDKASVLDEILTKHPEMEFVQLQINYIDWEDENIESRKCFEVALKHNKNIIIMEPVKGGALANVPKEAEEILKANNPSASVASWAVRYAASLKNVIMVLSGMSNEAQLLDNISYMQDFKPISETEKEVINSVTQIIKTGIKIPCTNCRYCVETCPQQIPIPEIFAAYNKGSKGDPSWSPSDCIECGECETLCPQHLPIRAFLKKLA
jgi:predicted aldo/keto reductase-like oxidoreductase